MSTATYRLQHPGTCTGMFWRNDPRGAGSQSGGKDWPRNGSLLRGTAFEHDGERWLAVAAWQQVGAGDWTEDCANLFMPFEQGGTLLHKVD
jgi:hypothetical protein